MTSPTRFIVADLALAATVLAAGCGGSGSPASSETTASRAAAQTLPACFPSCDGANFRKGNFKGVELSEGSFEGADFSEADLTGSQMRGVELNEVSFAGANLTGVELTGAELIDADFTGAVWKDTTCPDGTRTSSAPCKF